MAICTACGKEKTESHSCDKVMVVSKGKKYDPIPFGSKRIIKGKSEMGNNNETCTDCNVIKGDYHHIGCAKEMCPVCGGQVIFCGCVDDDDDDDDNL